MSTSEPVTVGTHVATIVTRFPTVTKNMIHQEAPARGRTIKPREVGRKEMRAFLTETLEDMERAQCHFSFCPGPDAPTQHMMTCFICYRVKRLRVMLAWLGE